jgi:hypothetical protein
VDRVRVLVDEPGERRHQLPHRRLPDEPGERDPGSGLRLRLASGQRKQHQPPRSRRPDATSPSRVPGHQPFGFDFNAAADVFVYDRTTDAITLVSSSSSGAIGNGTSTLPSISADGSLVAFQSTASNLTQTDTNSLTDVFVKNIQTGAIYEVSTVDRQGATLCCGYGPVISPDGRFVVYRGSGTPLLLYDHEAGNSLQFTSQGSQPSISENGRYIAFSSNGSLMRHQLGNRCLRLRSGDRNHRPGFACLCFWPVERCEL